jgi:hypothetical protein
MRIVKQLEHWPIERLAPRFSVTMVDIDFRPHPLRRVALALRERCRRTPGRRP